MHNSPAWSSGQSSSSWITGKWSPRELLHAFVSLSIARHYGIGPILNADISDARRARLSLADVLSRLSRLESLVAVPAFVPSGGQFSPVSQAAGQPATLFGGNFNVGTLRWTSSGRTSSASRRPSWWAR